jgi:hypothetical protein
METRINKKIDEYLTEMIDNLTLYINENVINDNNKNNVINIINNYPKLSINKTDIQKRKRLKNQVPLYLKCNACRANGEQCTRRRKTDGKYKNEPTNLCGTHIKGTPHGTIENDTTIQKPKSWSRMKPIVQWSQLIFYKHEERKYASR